MSKYQVPVKRVVIYHAYVTADNPSQAMDFADDICYSPERNNELKKVSEEWEVIDAFEVIRP